MKVELKKETKPDGAIWFYIYANEHCIESFSEAREIDARRFFLKYGEVETKIEVLETKEVKP